MPTLDTNLQWGDTHCNSNVICVVDIRVGGTEPEEADLLEICLLPLNHSYKPHTVFPIFNLHIKPIYPVDLKIARLSSDKVIGEYNAYSDAIQVAELFEHWVTKLNLKTNKKILPLSFDWVKKKKWVEHWLGPITYDHYFSESYRDGLPLMNFINDRAGYHGDKVPFTAPILAKFINEAGEKRFDLNSLPANCLGIADAYRKLLHNR